jgi:acetyltransferase-like isoleucine patch superfamily enzyme
LSNRVLRSVQRYLVPGVFVALYFLLKFGCGVSPKAIVQLSNKIRIGKGTLVKPFAVIQTNAGRITIGEHCAINNFVIISTVEADVTLGDYVRIGPHVTIMGPRGTSRGRTS